VKRRSFSQDSNFWAVIAIVLAVSVAMVITYFHIYPTEGLVGPLPFHHWASITGMSIIALFVPIYSILKRRQPKTRRSLYKIHPYINMAAFGLISVHFAHHLIEEINPVIDTGTGFLQYLVLTSLVATGIIRKFQFAPKQTKMWSFLHVSLTVSLYLIVSMHVLRALRLL
jgi:hypothetical protein